MTKELIGPCWSPHYSQHLWKRYLINMDVYDRLWGIQNGKCAGCLEGFAHPVRKDVTVGLRPEVDHDHTKPKGQVRGLLCRRCNDFLGKIQDDNEILKRLEAYLVTPPGSFI